MSEDSSTDRVSKTRAVFGDLTNRPSKRNFSVFSGLKSVDGSGKNSEIDSRFTKQLRTEVKQFIQERAGTNPAEPSMSTSNNSNNNKDKQPCRSSSNSAETEGSDEITGSQVSVARESGDASTWTKLWNEACWRQASDSGLTDPVVTVAGPTVTVCKESQEEGLGIGSKKPSSVEWSKFLSQGFQSYELGRCVNVDEDVLKNCSCSFCLKAAYIWSDLQYQDIKGRISALKRSQKEASALAQGSSKGTETNVAPGQENSVKSSKLESDLTGQWKSLFCHMEDVLQNENNQLEASFLMLKELRENCKTDLEIINATPSKNH